MYDLGIIGAGSAGYVAAERAGLAGLGVVLFDKGKLGGVCLNEGCIPTKALLYAAKLYDHAREGAPYGIQTREVTFDFVKMMARKNKVVKKLVAGVAAKMKKAGVEMVQSEARISVRKSDHLVISAGDQSYLCRNILLATGAQAVLPPIKGLDRENILTSTEILNITELPESLNIIGGGVIGLEFASLFNSLGTKVNVFEMMEEILPGTDPEFSGMLRKELSRKGVGFHTATRVTEVRNQDVIFKTKDGNEETVSADKLLVSVGRRPDLARLGLDESGVIYSQDGVRIDAFCRTNIPNIYAAGDITGFSQLAHTASREGTVAVNHILGKTDRIRYEAVPNVVYTNPEIAWVGLTEEEAKTKGIPVKILKLPMGFAGRFIVENEGKNGMAKMIIGEKYGEVLGVHLYGNPASELIHSAAIAIEMEMRVEELQQIIFPHPTVSEIIHEIAYEA
ncbi:MAG: dihydrolipoyl dehydrogenase [Bacteroidales bacterium]|nr:dihydrolipoyl dehydrogenase [Bacteroidales bacterium]